MSNTDSSTFIEVITPALESRPKWMYGTRGRKTLRHNNAERPGTSSFLETTLRAVTFYLTEGAISADVLKEYPWNPIGQKIWSQVQLEDLQSFYVWRLVRTAYHKELAENEYQDTQSMEHKESSGPKREYVVKLWSPNGAPDLPGLGKKLSVSPSLFLVNLFLFRRVGTRQDLISLSTIPNLAVLWCDNVLYTSWSQSTRTQSEALIDITIIRAWYSRAVYNGGFRCLRVLCIYQTEQHDHTSDEWCLDIDHITLFEALPALRQVHSSVTLQGHRHSDDESVGQACERIGWEFRRSIQHDQETKPDKQMQDAWLEASGKLEGDGEGSSSKVLTPVSLNVLWDDVRTRPVGWWLHRKDFWTARNAKRKLKQFDAVLNLEATGNKAPKLRGHKAVDVAGLLSSF